MQWLTQASAGELRRLVAEGEFFWLDLLHPTAEEVQQLVETIGLDPAATDRALAFDQTPQLRRYHQHIGLVFYGAERDELVEVHVVVGGGWVVTLHQSAFPALDELRDDLSQSDGLDEESVVGRVLAALADSFEDLLDPLDDRIDELESQAVAVEEGRAAPGDLRREILQRRRALLGKLRIVRRQRDYVDRAIGELDQLPGLDQSQRHDLHDVSLQMIRVTDAVGDARDRLGDALDLLSSSISNRMNAIMERLTVVATIFLPLTALTGFFGMNFAWLVRQIDSFGAFLGFGLVLIGASGVLTYLWVRSRLERSASG